MRVQVIYNVPVIAVVDTEDGTVDRVWVSNEEISLNEKDSPVEDGSLNSIDPDTAQKAIDIAENNEWPAWD